MPCPQLHHWRKRARLGMAVLPTKPQVPGVEIVAARRIALCQCFWSAQLPSGYPGMLGNVGQPLWRVAPIVPYETCLAGGPGEHDVHDPVLTPTPA